MSKRTFLVWVMVFVFGIASLPVIGFSAENKQTGNTEISKKKPKKKFSKKNKKSLKKTKGSKKNLSAGKKKYSKTKKYSKNKKYVGKKKYSSKKSSKRNKTYKRKYYAPRTNSSNVEYRNYKRNSDPENSGNNEINIEKIAPSKEIRKEPKKEGDN
jgi:hypothetical protein